MSAGAYRMQKAIMLWIVAMLSLITLLDNGLSFYAIKLIAGMGFIVVVAIMALASCIHGK